MLPPDPAERFLCDTEIGSDHPQWNSLDKAGIGIHQCPVTLCRRSKMQVVKSLLQLYQPKADQQPAQSFNIVIMLVQLLQLVMMQSPYNSILQQVDPPSVRLSCKEADDGTGKHILRAQPVGDILAILIIKSSRETLLDKINIMTYRILLYQHMPFWQFHPSQN